MRPASFVVAEQAEDAGARANGEPPSESRAGAAENGRFLHGVEVGFPVVG